MVEAGGFWKRDPVLRIGGLVLLLCCWTLMRWLVRSPDLHARHDPTLVEFAAAAAGFLCFSAGGALATLGAHVFDKVEVSERWAQRRYAPPPPGDAGITPACLAALAREMDAHRERAPMAAPPVRLTEQADAFQTAQAER